MIIKRTFFIKILVLCVAQLSGQIIERTVINSAGEVYGNNAGRLSFSVGETLTNYYLLETHLCQGFQQSELVDVPLAFGLINFGAYRIDENWVHFDWQIEYQENLDYFILERRKNESDDFIFISKHSKEETNNYETKDENKAVQESFYRLKYFHKDGDFQYSKVIVINGTPLKNFITAQPNPTAGVINLQIEPDARQAFSKMELTISSAQGKALHRQSITYSQSNINIYQLQNYPAGIYYLTISTDTDYREFIKVVKSNGE